MSKITLTDLVNLQNETTAVNAINTNSSVIELAFDNTLSLDGTAPNQMRADLDMNSNDILNLPAPTSNYSPIRLIDAATLEGGGSITVSPLPTGGTTDQVLGKVNATDFNVSWRSPVKAGGATGQVLGKNSASDGDVDWKNPVATGGTAGQLLKKASGTNFDTVWVDATAAVSAGNGITITGTSPATISVRDFISVKDFGATGNGLTDDAPAFRAAYAACVDGGAIKIPATANSYMMKSAVSGAVIPMAGSKAVSWIGEGWNIKAGGSYTTPSGSVIKLHSSLSDSTDVFHYTGTDLVTGITLSDFMICGASGTFSGDAGRHGIFIDATGTDLFYLTEMTINHVFIGNMKTGNSIRTFAGSNSAGALNYSTIQNCQFMSMKSDFIGDNVQILHNNLGQNATLDSRNVGIEFSTNSGATSTVIANNVIQNFNGMIIVHGGVGLVIRDNEFEIGAANVNTHGSIIDLLGDVTAIFQATITGNSISQNSTQGNYFPINVANAKGVSIFSNRISTPTVYGHVNITSAAVNTTVGVNHAEAPSGTTVNITVVNNSNTTNGVPIQIGAVNGTDLLNIGGTANMFVLKMNGATSGNTVVTSASTASGAWSIPASTDTFVGKATTDTLTNKTLDTAGTGNVFKINGTTVNAVTGTGSAVLATSPVLVTPALGTPSALVGTNITGTAAGLTVGTSTNATITNDVATASQVFPVWSAANSGSNALKVSSTKVALTPSTGQVALFSTAYLGSSSGTTVVTPAATTSGTLTLPAATDTLVGKATTDTLTNKTFNSTGTGNVLQVSGVTVSAGQYPGEPTTGSATAGNVGEYIESNIASGSAVALANGVAKDITTISLTAGDWDVEFIPQFTGAVSTTLSYISASISLTLNTFDTTLGRFSVSPFTGGALFASGAPGNFVTSPPFTVRMSISATTTIHAVANASFGVSTCSGFGLLRARRVR